MEKQVIKVNGMSCGHCVKAIENALDAIGVKVEINLNEKTVTVEYNPQDLNLDKIVAEIEDQGYEVVNMLLQE